MKCSISVVLPMPGSPATQTTMRLPVQARSHWAASRDSASARPMNDGEAEETVLAAPPLLGAPTAVVGAMNR